FYFFFQAEDGIRDFHVTGVQTCALPILAAGVSRNAISQVQQPSSSVAAGQVIGTSPSGRVPAGQAVQLLVSSGPEQVSVPDVVKDRKSTRLNSSHVKISYAVFCLKKKKT